MTRLRKGPRLGLLAVLLAAAGTAGAADVPQTTQDGGQIVTYAQLGAIVKQYRDKVLVIDFWNIHCGPCINEGLPHLVAMRKQYPEDQLGILSVHLDLDKDEKPSEVTAILKSKGAAGLRSLLLDEPQEVWQKKLRFDSYPCLYVFNQKGEWTQFSGENKKYENDKDLQPMLHDVDQLVQSLLKKK